MNAIDIIKNKQFSWAKERGISIDKDGYVDNLNDNYLNLLNKRPRGNLI